MDNKSSRNENFYFFVFVYFPRKQLRIVVVRTLVNGWKKMNGRHPIGHESLSLNIIIIVIIIIECWSAFWVLKLQLRKSSTHEVIYAKPENQWNSIRESWAHVRVCVCVCINSACSINLFCSTLTCSIYYYYYYQMYSTHSFSGHCLFFWHAF